MAHTFFDRQSGKLDLSCIRVFVIDEADRMADEENVKIVMDVFDKLPKVRRHRTLQADRRDSCCRC